MTRLNVAALAVAGGVSWGLGVLFLGWAAAWFDWGTDLVRTLASLYLGLEPSVLGGLIGCVWGFVDGAIGGALVAILYNLVAAGRSQAEKA